MGTIRLLFIAILSAIFCCARAQDNTYALSKPVAIDQEGWNRVLCMKNGNTLLFHFQKDRKIVVKVFDSTRREIASQKDDYHILEFRLTDFTIKGVYDINDEAVLFFDQDIDSRHSLIRIRYNSHTGKLVEEKLLAESKSENKRMKFYVMKHKDDENYQVLFCTDMRHPRESDIFCVFFNNKHESIKEVQLPVDRKIYDDLEIVGAETHLNGVLITAALTKTEVYGLAGSKAPISKESSVDDHFLQFYYIPMESKNMKSTIVHLSTGVFPYHAYYTFNPFAQTLNVLLFSYKKLLYKFGLNIQTGTVSRDLFFKIDPQDMSSIGINEIKNDTANYFLKKQTDTTRYYGGAPLKMYTDENGRTTIISETFIQASGVNTMNGIGSETFIQMMGITQVDDNGNEIFGTVLPLSQYYNYATSLPRYSGEFMGIHPFPLGRNFYMVYNDYNKNFGNSLSNPGDTVFNFNITNACYYKMDSKKVVTKHYLFGEPVANEYKCSFVSGADYDKERGVYATLVQYKKKDGITLCMGWRKMD